MISMWCVGYDVGKNYYEPRQASFYNVIIELALIEYGIVSLGRFVLPRYC